MCHQTLKTNGICEHVKQGDLQQTPAEALHTVWGSLQLPDSTSFSPPKRYRASLFSTTASLAISGSSAAQPLRPQRVLPMSYQVALKIPEFLLYFEVELII